MTSTAVGIPGPQTHLGFLSATAVGLNPTSGCRVRAIARSTLFSALAAETGQGSHPTSVVGHPWPHSQSALLIPGHSPPTLSAVSTLRLDTAIPAHQQGPHGGPMSQGPMLSASSRGSAKQYHKMEPSFMNSTDLRMSAPHPGSPDRLGSSLPCDPSSPM